MAYDPTVWKSGDTITSAKLNKLENGLAEASGGGTGGGVLKVGVNGQSQMDKTYAEIKAAFMEGIVFNILPTSDGYVLCIVTNCYNGEEGCYVSLNRMYGGGELSFECQTENDYPTLSN